MTNGKNQFTIWQKPGIYRSLQSFFNYGVNKWDPWLSYTK